MLRSQDKDHMNNRYTAQQICVLVPTKDRPEHVKNLLKSIADQDERVGRIIMVATGENIQATVEEFSNVLPIEYFHTSQSGQIRQRNMGIQKLDDRTCLVACLDDDIVLGPGAIKEMIQFWNSTPEDTGGVGFNITNGINTPPHLLYQLLLVDHRLPGRVLPSGNQSSISHLQTNIRSQWLAGGTTVWRQDILVNNRHKEIDTKWAIAEDLIFSYPVGKVFPLYVCASATVSHNHYPYDGQDNQWHFLYGRTQSLWVYHFVRSNRELSKTLFFSTLLVRVSLKSIYGVLTRRTENVHFSLGVISAVWVIIKDAFCWSSQKDIREN